MTARAGDDYFTIQGIRMLAPTLHHAVLSAITAAALLAVSTAAAQRDPVNPPDETRSTVQHTNIGFEAPKVGQE
jgi:hypothetical protein